MSYKSTGGMASRAVQGEPVEPVPERTEGIVFPYRGIQNHGVAPEQAPQQYVDDQWAPDDEAPHYVDGPTEDEPIPVRIVQQNNTPTLRRITRTRQIPVTDSSQVVGRNDGRIRLWVKNIGANAVWITSEKVEPAAAAISGYKLSVTTATGSELQHIDTTEELYASTGDGTTSTLCVIELIEIPV